MILFRVLCALLLAWAFNLALGRPEAEPVLRALDAVEPKIPDLRVFGPIAAGVVGFLNLAVRQGWGMIVGLVNGIWSGLLSLAVGGFFVFCGAIYMRLQENLLKDFDDFLKHVALIRNPLLEAILDVKFIVVTLGMCAVVGVITEVAQWLVARVRGNKNQSSNTTT